MTQKVMLVTGAGSGMGQLAARRALAAGWNVAALDVDSQGLEALGDQPGLLKCKTDITDFAAVQAAVAQCEAQWGAIDRLVNAAARFCPLGGKLVLCHVEDDIAFRRHIDAIGRIPQINTDQARELIAEQLLAVALNYVESCEAALAKSDLDCEVERVVEFGHRIVRYRQLADQRKVDLLVANTKDDDQLAMHGLAYALSVEITDVPQLLL